MKTNLFLLYSLLILLLAYNLIVDNKHNKQYNQLQQQLTTLKTDLAYFATNTTSTTNYIVVTNTTSIEEQRRQWDMVNSLRNSNNKQPKSIGFGAW